MTLAYKKVAEIDKSLCKSWNGKPCHACARACPRIGEGLKFTLEGPEVDISNCDGCPNCVESCEAVNKKSAIRIVSLAQHFPKLSM